jgi:aryl-alcohol dehydrogenase-like predicted oxidoreductase
MGPTELYPGAASPEGTRRFRDRAVRGGKAVAEHFRAAPLGLELSSFGLGTYLGRPDGATDLAVEEAVRVVLQSGRVNVLDTAINYRHQRAERSLGRSVRRLLRVTPVRRDEVFISTKVGYLAPDGESSMDPRAWVEETLIRPGILDPADIVDGSHALSPDYLRDQVARSRVNLGLETIDLLYLHNPADAQLATLGRPEFAKRMGAAFQTLEELRKQGWLRHYGMATWETFRVAAGDPGYLSLEEIVGWARAAGGPSHGFAAIQFPFNLLMPEGATLTEQSVGGERCSTFEAARRLGIACFTSVPLAQGRLARHGLSRDGLSPAQSALQAARSAPSTTAPVAGLKQPEHLSEALALAERPPWDAVAFAETLS